MKKRDISFSSPDITEYEIAEATEALRSGWITTGPRTKLLERRLAAYIESGKTDVDCSAEEAEARYGKKQERVTQYGRHFRIHKFRTMVSDADKIGSAVTVGGYSRITRVGAKLRGLHLDELPQVIDVIAGDMSFVGTRPEAVKYVERYRPEYNATLLMPAGITSECSIRYKDENKLLSAAKDVDEVYVNRVLPEKMKLNL